MMYTYLTNKQKLQSSPPSIAAAGQTAPSQTECSTPLEPITLKKSESPPAPAHAATPPPPLPSQPLTEEQRALNVIDVVLDYNEFHELIIDKKINIVLMTGTQLYSKGDESYITEMTPKGYEYKSFPSTNVRRGGGICVMSVKIFLIT